MATRLRAWASASREPDPDSDEPRLVMGGQSIPNLRDDCLRHDFPHTPTKTIVNQAEVPKSGIQELGNAEIGPYQRGETPN